MKNIVLGFIIILGVSTPSIILSQNKNRIAIQTGLFHLHFDKTPLLTNTKTTNKLLLRNPHSYFGGYFNESLGFMYERKLPKETTFSLEYMTQKTGYYFSGFTDNVKGPFLIAKNTKKVNLSYHKKIRLFEKWKWAVGSGLNYLWGDELVYLYSTPTSYGSFHPHFHNIYRNDFGFNIRTGIEYTPTERITLYSDFDFLGVAFLGTSGKKSHQYFKDEYGIDYLPSRWDVSWQFGIGYNFN